MARGALALLAPLGLLSACGDADRDAATVYIPQPELTVTVASASAPAPAPPPLRPALQTPPQAYANQSDIDRLAARNLEVPVAGVPRVLLTNSWSDARGGGRRHSAIDIAADAGTPVIAVEDGRIVKLFASKAGGLTIYQFDPAGEYVYYYAHLQGYADGLTEGMCVRRGQVIGRVGSTGNASPDATHLHFEIVRLSPQKQWWKGDAVNPHPVLTVTRDGAVPLRNEPAQPQPRVCPSDASSAPAPRPPSR
ncbi:MAG: M23 family metallopeptidase [Rubrivivax sp.]